MFLSTLSIRNDHKIKVTFGQIEDMEVVVFVIYSTYSSVICIITVSGKGIYVFVVAITKKNI